jgi:hypothetical protein
MFLRLILLADWDELTVMSRSHKPHYPDTPSPSEDYKPWPISAGELASLIDLGLSNNQIASYFGVEPRRVSALRAYYGLANANSESGRNQLSDLISEDGCC